MSRGTPSMGKRNKRNHLMCPRCGSMSYHKQIKRCSKCAFPDAKRRTPGSIKARRRKEGKRKYIKNSIRKSKTGFKQHPIIEAMIR